MHSIWWGRLAAKIREERDKKVEFLVSGGATIIQNFPTAENYQQQVGFIRGLDEALQLATEVDNIMLGMVPNDAPRPPDKDD